MGKNEEHSVSVNDALRRYCPVCSAETFERVCREDGTTTLLVNAPASDPNRMKEGHILADRHQIDRELGRGGFGALDAYKPDGVERLAELGVTDVIIGFRNSYQLAQDDEPFERKIGALQKYAKRVISRFD